MRTIGFLYDRGSPFEAPLAVQLARLCTLRVSTYEHVDKLARWLVRGAPPDVLEPSAIPLVPHLRWRGGLQGPWLRWRMRGCEAVVFTRIDQAPLLAAVRDRRRVAIIYDDDTWFGRSPAHERAMVAGCDFLLPVSQVLADRMAARTGAPQEKFRVVPMGANPEGVPATLPIRPAALPGSRPTPRPLAGILGGISPGRYRLDWIEHCVNRLPWLHWLFAGRIEWGGLSADETAILRRLAAHARCRLLEGQSHAAGWSADNPQLLYAPALDVAVIPYSDHPSIAAASPARAYFHFAQGTPVLATSSCPQLCDHGPLVLRGDSPEAFVAALERLRAQNFDDGHRAARWQLARDNTTAHRARAIVAHVESLFTPSRP